MNQTTNAKAAAAAITPSTVSKQKRSLDAYQDLSPEQLLSALKDRDAHIVKLEKECKRLKTSKKATQGGAVAPIISPEQIQAKATKLRGVVYKGIKSQMKWKPSCKRGTARFSFEGMCDEPTFRGFMRLQEKDKTKGQRMDCEKFQSEILGYQLVASIRYGYLMAKGNVNITFSKDDGIVKINGGYGM